MVGSGYGHGVGHGPSFYLQKTEEYGRDATFWMRKASGTDADDVACAMAKWAAHYARLLGVGR